MVVGELSQERDVVIIGGGPGGYHAAIRAAQLGLQVTLIEKKQLGGLCLHEGCIPSKLHTAAAQNFERLHGFKNLGMKIDQVVFALDVLQEHKHKTINTLKKGIEALCKANKIEIIEGEASFLAQGKIGVENGHQYDTFTYQYAIIASGCPRKPILETKTKTLTPKTMWNLDELPDELILYGNDDYVLEIATAFNSFGSSVTILLPPNSDEFSFDSSLTKELNRQLKKQKIKVIKLSEPPTIEEIGDKYEINCKDKANSTLQLTSSHVYVAEERAPKEVTLGLDRAGVNLDDRSFVEINEGCQTNVPNIYAIGDITSGPALAVKAIKQGKVAAENISGMNTVYDLTFLPRVLQTIPPIATVGLTEHAAIDAGYKVKIGESPLQSNGYATIIGEKAGVIKTISDQETDVLLGMHIIGSHAVEQISSGVLALEMVAREEDMLFPLYPHPSLNECLLESVEDTTDKAIHKPPQVKKQKVTAT
ncbi:Dihydrolipoyl dehydrogenase [Bacillus sp. THAF10]|uniref:dihydrolipoyl dehydrogenase family protein n=1 Tax=Bacillus sp. THAF10 TaxID=2587848 RepID=UPI001267A4CF|nr:FAD-dependent oxidoreductase [Bacillus sp. THAF10]QFT89203.1 Dihydrolipoyl dehydrogenase [Bacillus sp. THAF10]